MWTRSVQLPPPNESVKVEATFQWDNGDTSAGIPAGWGESTCVEITAGPFVIWLTWVDFSFTLRRMASRGGGRIEVDSQNPATWVIDTVEAEYRAGGNTLPLASHVAREDTWRVIRLAELPEVLGVVWDAFKDYKAAQRLSVAQENVQMLEAEVDSVKWHISANDEPTDHDTLRLEGLTGSLSEAREEAQVAYEHARERGVA